MIQYYLRAKLRVKNTRKRNILLQVCGLPFNERLEAPIQGEHKNGAGEVLTCCCCPARRCED